MRRSPDRSPNRSPRRAIAAAALCAAMVAVLPQGTARAQNGAASSWQRQPAPALLPGSGLNSVAAISRDDVWVAGSQGYRDRGFQCDGCYDEMPALQHWDGASWKSYNLPGFPTAPAGGFNAVTQVSALSSDDVWAYGRTGSTTRLEHWDGSTWTGMITPNYGDLMAVTGGQVWVGGWTGFARWDGRSWTTFDSPGAFAWGMTARTPADAWAVGYRIRHWDGTAWTTSPSPQIAGSRLVGVTANAADDVWAVGSATTVSGSGTIVTNTPIALHYDGTTWTQEDLTAVAPAKAVLTGVSGTADGGVRAVGYEDGVALRPLILRYENGTWTREDVPVVDLRTPRLYAISQIPGTDRAWTVGQAALTNFGFLPTNLIYHN